MLPPSQTDASQRGNTAPSDRARERSRPSIYASAHWQQDQSARRRRKIKPIRPRVRNAALPGSGTALPYRDAGLVPSSALGRKLVHASPQRTPVRADMATTRRLRKAGQTHSAPMKLLLRGPGRVGVGRRAGTGCEWVCPLLLGGTDQARRGQGGAGSIAEVQFVSHPCRF